MYWLPPKSTDNENVEKYLANLREKDYTGKSDYELLKSTIIPHWSVILVVLSLSMSSLSSLNALDLILTAVIVFFLILWRITVIRNFKLIDLLVEKDSEQKILE